MEKEGHFDALRCTRALGINLSAAFCRGSAGGVYYFITCCSALKKIFYSLRPACCCCRRESHAHCAQLGGAVCVFRFVKPSLAHATRLFSAGMQKGCDFEILNREEDKEAGQRTTCRCAQEFPPARALIILEYVI